MRSSRRTDTEALVAQAMQELADAPHDSSRLPDPSFIWWKAQFLRRLDAEREATAPLEVGDRMHIGAAVLGAVALGVGAWNHVPALSLSVESGMALAAGLAILLAIAALAALDALRQR
ncbi:MAG: hypothetical protein U0Q55_12365 [Vicinamibacterales bacterium]